MTNYSNWVHADTTALDSLRMIKYCEDMMMHLPVLSSDGKKVVGLVLKIDVMDLLCHIVDGNKAWRIGGIIASVLRC